MPINPEQLKAQALGVLRQFYGYPSFLPMQYEVISHIMSGGRRRQVALLSNPCAVERWLLRGGFAAVGVDERPGGRPDC